MRLLFVFVVIATVVTVIKSYSEDDHWKDFKKKHKKDYRPSSDGGKNDKTRKELFRARDKQIKKHNSEKAGTFRKEHNQFSDLWPLELRSYLGVNATAVPSLAFMSSVSVDLESRAVRRAVLPRGVSRILATFTNRFLIIATFHFWECGRG
ncbi:cathepsin L-like proteinase [Daphnia pulex]|uniref:cathepsin L-like proteinase n=1 Tax=Daphnia pulex TaxID=6669 RepID=UPI001EDE8C86|nr:cathepsin L-like proteinase [Daphnia pulex]